MAEDFDFNTLNEFFEQDAEPKEQGGSTRSVHSGANRTKGYNSLTTPVVQTATYTFRDTQELIDYMERKTWGEGEDREEYGRYGNPTRRSKQSWRRRRWPSGWRTRMGRCGCGIRRRSASSGGAGTR